MKPILSLEEHEMRLDRVYDDFSAFVKNNTMSDEEIRKKAEDVFFWKKDCNELFDVMQKDLENFSKSLHCNLCINTSRSSTNVEEYGYDTYTVPVFMIKIGNMGKVVSVEPFAINGLRKLGVLYMIGSDGRVTLRREVNDGHGRFVRWMFNTISFNDGELAMYDRELTERSFLRILMILCGYK